MKRPLAALFLALAPLLVLAACGNKTDRRQAFRDTATPIYSNASLSAAALAGRWSQTSAFTNTPGKGCRSGGAMIEPTATGITLRARLCLDGDSRDLATDLATTGPGRLTPTGKAPAPLDRQWWVLWADTDLRTVVIGTPDGSFGFILNRDGPLPPDRLTAARQVLAFNGYDTTRLQSW
ncbi:lipocalin family protein [Paragemmobacter straminiformis]|uniref:lipocalin family protein n=1 Tax=Paragemmobacter straminiformis TaxID=2045119 RepID=UPI0030CA1B8D